MVSGANSAVIGTVSTVCYTVGVTIAGEGRLSGTSAGEAHVRYAALVCPVSGRDGVKIYAIRTSPSLPARGGTG